MSTATATQLAARAKSRKYRASHLAQEAKRARAWRKTNRGYSTPYVAQARGTARQCSSFTTPRGLSHFVSTGIQCANRTRHESGLCWRHRAGRARA